MTTQQFLSLLKDHQGKSLVFEYAPNQLVGTNYHITEIKNIIVDAVDCGAGTDYWKETVIQLWESPMEKDKPAYMSAYKALSILKKVDRIKPMVQEAEVKFEYGNAIFHTTQLAVKDFVINANQLRIVLTTVAADCKAKDACGITEEPETTTANSCTPGSGCC